MTNSSDPRIITDNNRIWHAKTDNSKPGRLYFSQESLDWLNKRLALATKSPLDRWRADLQIARHRLIVSLQIFAFQLAFFVRVLLRVPIRKTTK